MKCKYNHEIKVFKHDDKYCIGTRDEYGPICSISPDLNSKEEADIYLSNLNKINDIHICVLCDND